MGGDNILVIRGLGRRPEVGNGNKTSGIDGEVKIELNEGCDDIHWWQIPYQSDCQSLQSQIVEGCHRKVAACVRVYVRS